MNESLVKNVDKLGQHLSLVIDMAIQYAPKLILSFAFLLIGLWLIGIANRGLEKVFEKRKFDLSLSHFLGSFFNILLKISLVIAVIEMVGIKTTSFVAILGAAGLAVGLALQGSLANFAGGVLILIFRPFQIGDYIIAQGEEGTVQKIDIFNTWLNKLDNRRVILPNGALASGTVVNVTAEEKRRVDIAVGISYSSNIDETRKVLFELARKDSRILKDPAPFMGLTEMADSSVNFTFRIWCKTENYWEVFFDTNEAVKKALDANNIAIPFPQRDVHLFNVSEKKETSL